MTMGTSSVFCPATRDDTGANKGEVVDQDFEIRQLRLLQQMVEQGERGLAK